MLDSTQPIQSAPFGEFKERTEELTPDLKETLCTSRANLLFFQEFYLEQLEDAPPKKRLKNALVFQRQLELAKSTLQPETPNKPNATETKGGSWPYPEPGKQSKRDSKLQEKVEKVDRMVNQLGFTLGPACKEAKISRQTAKKWLSRRDSFGTLVPI